MRQIYHTQPQKAFNINDLARARGRAKWLILHAFMRLPLSQSIPTSHWRCVNILNLIH